MNKTLTIALTVGALALTGCGPSGPRPLEKATGNCLQSGGEHWELQDGGKAVKLVIRGLAMSGLHHDEADCVLKAAGAPDAILTKIDNTKVGGGPQTGTWDGFEASWEIDPIDGTAILVKEK